MIVSAGNSIDDNAAVTEEMSTALKSRMAHINLEISVEDWLNWAHSAGVHHSITSFIEFKKTALYNFNPNVAADTYPCPRTWAMVARLVDTVGLNDPTISDLIAATISDGTAAEYLGFVKYFSRLPTFAEIIKDPENIRLPEELGEQYALAGSIATSLEMDNVATAWKAVTRMPMEFQMCIFHQATLRKPLLATKLVAWAKEFAPKLIKARN